MSTNFMIICDKAEVVNDTGKLTINGIFDSVYAEKIPVRLASCSIVTSIDRGETNLGSEHEQYSKIRKDSQEVATTNKLTFSIIRDKHQIINNVIGLELKEFGKYDVESYIDDKLVGKTYFIFSERK